VGTFPATIGNLVHSAGRVMIGEEPSVYDLPFNTELIQERIENAIAPHRNRESLITMSGRAGGDVALIFTPTPSIRPAAWLSKFVRTAPPLANETTFTRVMANIAESQAARRSSNIDVLLAKEAQFTAAGYGKMDAWTMVTVNKGDVMVRGVPGTTAFMTNMEAVVQSAGNRANLGQMLQVVPHKDLGYRPGVEVFVAKDDFRVARSVTNANSHLGSGQAVQYFVLRNGKLESVGFIPMKPAGPTPAVAPVNQVTPH
jgi:hypothetical protein